MTKLKMPMKPSTDLAEVSQIGYTARILIKIPIAVINFNEGNTVVCWHLPTATGNQEAPKAL